MLSSLWLPIAVLAIFLLLIVPLPPFILDMFVAVNLTIGVLLLLSAIYVTKPLDFSTFPTVLLFTTIFRIGISVATTRAILAEMDAGHIIQQFGEMVAGGLLAVGLVIFLILAIVQFIVIAKGAERVAEVAARFSLDAMPGKQLSIDSDLRSGLLSKDEAREKRRVLEMESKFNGSLDGAMKFVKGDAIASICIVLINLIGGIAVGMFSHGLSLSQSAEVFSILTIGDGLVAQLPALFSALAAGILVTRTTDEEREKELAPVIAQQIVGKPHVLFIAAAVCVLLGLIPGFPMLTFFGLAAVLAGTGLFRHPVSAPVVRAKLGMPEIQMAPVGQARIAAAAPIAVEPLRLTVGISGNSADFAALNDEVTAAVDRVQARSGVPIPALSLQSVDGLDANAWDLQAFEAPLGQGISKAENPPLHIALLTEHLLENNLSIFLGLQEVTNMLDQLGEEYPEVVKEAVRAVPVGKIAEILKILAEERVSIRNLRDIVEAIADISQYERDTGPMVERVRVAIRRQLNAPLCVDGRLKALMIGGELEAIIRETLTEVDGQFRLAINPAQMRALIALVRSESEATGAQVILTSQDLRRPMRLLIAADLPGTAVLSFNELNPTVPLDILGEMNRAADALNHDENISASERSAA
ncbi:FHIPEP family type III secretion protein [Sphingorhabdus arenilitoris]|uniref:FHIPEP family type III secretion protein n=1 Tax=Sphingorhabdus arenilitoris TaxID=1490041 RepID=A0ABV8RI42_9SPHN